MRRLISFLLAVLMLGTMVVSASASGEESPTAVGAAETLTASVSKMEILLDGVSVKPAGYVIGGYTYFKLRDIAYLMQNKQSSFSVAYDNAAQRISLTRGASYEVDGSELAAVGSNSEKARASKLSVLVDGKSVSMQAYNIRDFTYFKLRDIGENLNFVVDYKDQSRQAIIKTPGYVEPEPDPPVDPIPPVKPTPPDAKGKIDGVLTVLIDVGHGGTDSGATGTAPIDYVDYRGRQVKAGDKMLEKDFNLPVALYLRDMLRESGAQVIMSRETDVSQSFAARKALIESNADKADLCFSIHHNAMNTKIKGFELLAQVAYKNGGAGKELAEILEKHYIASGGTRRRSTIFREGQNGDYYAILRYAANVDMLAMMSEYVYMDNAEDVRSILSDDGLFTEAQAIHDGIMQYYATAAY